MTKGIALTLMGMVLLAATAFAGDPPQVGGSQGCQGEIRTGGQGA